MTLSSLPLETQDEAGIGGSASLTIKHRPVIVDHDRDIEHLQTVLIKLHDTFYSSLAVDPSSADVRTILPSIKSRVLRGVEILFSGVIPGGFPPERHDLWRHAEICGAICRVELSDTVSHVVAAKPGTIKVNDAKEYPHIWVVKPDWYGMFLGRLVDCVTKWRHSAEEEFCLIPGQFPSVDARKTVEKDLDIADEKLDDADVAARFGHDDWKNMDNEVNEALGDTSEDEQTDGLEDTWSCLDDEFAEIEEDLVIEDSQETMRKRKHRD